MASRACREEIKHFNTCGIQCIEISRASYSCEQIHPFWLITTDNVDHEQSDKSHSYNLYILYLYLKQNKMYGIVYYNIDIENPYF